ncbi:Trypsin [Popillia japonica]|uniref:Trypsin n=1 Tax=Popillia japonica TaxID=7064 RepID=A0AAW1JF94_POPJA
MKTLPVLIATVLCLNAFVNGTDFYWMASGNTCEKSYGRHNLCIHYKNDTSDESYESYEIEKIPSLHHKPSQSSWDVSEEYWGSDEHDYDYDHHFNSGSSPEYHFGGSYYDWLKPSPNKGGAGDGDFPNFNDDSGLPAGSSEDGLDPSNRGQDGGALTDNDGKSVSNSTSLRMCSQYYKSDGTVYVAVVGGEDARPKEFPHIALLGYGDPNNIVWQCGGSLISDRYILTAAHCTFSRTEGAVRYVRLGELDLNSTTDDANVTEFTVAEITTHPLYNFGSNYHDIALLRLNATITSFNDYVKPACLATTRDVENANLKIAGWGVIENNGPQASILQTAFLQHVPHERCRRSYGRSAKLRQGIIEDVHVCADGGTERRDACNGDSGGPLQFTNTDYANEGIASFVELVGVTSFGFRCALVLSASLCFTSDFITSTTLCLNLWSLIASTLYKQLLQVVCMLR